ncbi:MAG: YlcI/YnfO family protein [Actinomycetota bacterium]
METAPFLDAIEADLAAAVEGDDDAGRSTARLSAVLRSSLQLRLFDAMGQASLELSEQMSSAHVEVRLAGRDVELVYVSDEPIAPTAGEGDDDGGTARLTLRMPESLKAAVERAADREGRSTNAWLVAAVKRALEHRGRRRAGNRLTGFGQS